MKKSIFLFVNLCFPVFLFSCEPEPMMDRIDDIEADTSSIYMAVFGDIQFYTNSINIDLYQHSLEWIQRKSDEGWNFNCVLHTGDITMNNQIAQWNRFYQATAPIAQVIPYITMIGDHDYTWEDGTHIEDRNSTLFNDYIQFPLTTSKVAAWFEEGRMENIVVENTIYGEHLDLLILELGPREDVVAWADSYVRTHPLEKFILMTHEYLEQGGGRRTKGLKMAARLKNTTYTTPEQLWERLIKCNDNIICVLCGHVGGLYALTVDTNDFGHEVPQIQHNIQSLEYRYDNWLMLWEFPADGDSVNVSIFNTQSLLYYNNKSTLFKFKYRNSLSVPILDTKKPISPYEAYELNGVRKSRRRGVSIRRGKDGADKTLNK